MSNRLKQDGTTTIKEILGTTAEIVLMVSYTYTSGVIDYILLDRSGKIFLSVANTIKLEIMSTLEVLEHLNTLKVISTSEVDKDNLDYFLGLVDDIDVSPKLLSKDNYISLPAGSPFGTSEYYVLSAKNRTEPVFLGSTGNKPLRSKDSVLRKCLRVCTTLLQDNN